MGVFFFFRFFSCGNNSGSDDWPSPAELVAMGTRVVIASSEPSTLVFSTDSDAVEVRVRMWVFV